MTDPSCDNTRSNCLECLYQTYLYGEDHYACERLRELYTRRFLERHREQMRALLNRHTIGVISALQELEQETVKILCLGAGAAPELAGIVDWMQEADLREIPLEVALVDKEQSWQDSLAETCKSLCDTVHELGSRVTLACIYDDALVKREGNYNIITLSYLLSALPPTSVSQVAGIYIANLSKPGVLLITDHGSEAMRNRVEALGTLIKAALPKAHVFYHFSSMATQCVILH